MTETAPDIEIYLKRIPRQDILDWLSTVFVIRESRQAGETLQLNLDNNGQSMDCMIVDNAARGGYVSLWFKQNRTIWQTDEECARAAFARFGQEIRCSKSSWASGQEDDGSWLRFTKDGVSQVNWRT